MAEPLHDDDDDAPARAAAPLAAAPLTDRVNVEPPLINGMTATEAKYVAMLAFPACIAVFGLVGWLIGHWQVVMVSMPATLTLLWTASKKLARVKRNRPDGYYQAAMKLWFARRGFGKSPFLQHDGHWDLGRSLDLDLSHSARHR